MRTYISEYKILRADVQGILTKNEQCKYWFDESKGLYIGMFYKLNEKYGDNTIVVYTKDKEDFFIVMYEDGEVVPHYSTFADDLHYFIMDKLNKDKKNLDGMCKEYKNSLELIEIMKETLSKRE